MDRDTLYHDCATCVSGCVIVPDDYRPLLGHSANTFHVGSVLVARRTDKLFGCSGRDSGSVDAASCDYFISSGYSNLGPRIYCGRSPCGRRGDGKLMALAHKIDPSDDLATASLVGAMILSNQHGPAFHRAWNLVDRYNGDLTPETPYYLLSLASFNIGAYSISKAMAQQSLVYADHAGARQILKVINEGR